MESQPKPVSSALQYTGSFSEDVYREKTPGWKRRFTLSGDRLIIQARQLLGSESELPVSLRGIDPVYGVVRQRSTIAGAGALILSAMFGSLLIPTLILRVTPSPSIGASIDGLLCLICLITGLMNIRRIEYYRFHSAAGQVFTIARSGPDRARFDAFIARLVVRIEELPQMPEAPVVSGTIPAPDPGGWIQVPTK